LSRNVQRIEGGLDQGDELSRYSHIHLSIRLFLCKLVSQFWSYSKMRDNFA